MPWIMDSQWANEQECLAQYICSEACHDQEAGQGPIGEFPLWQEAVGAPSRPPGFVQKLI